MATLSVNDIVYSIREHLRTDPDVGTATVLSFYSGINRAEFDRPFIVVRSLSDLVDFISAGRHTYYYKALIQIEIFTNDEYYLQELTSHVRDSLLHNAIPLYKVSVDTGNPVGFFYVDDGMSSERMPSDDPSEESADHRNYLTCETEIVIDNQNGTRVP